MDKSLKLKLFVTVSLMDSEFGKTIKEVNKDKFKITDKVEILLSSDTNSGIAKTVGLGVISFTREL